MLVASYIALRLGFGDSYSLILELMVFHSPIGLPANFQDLLVSMHPTLELHTDEHQAQLLHGCWGSKLRSSCFHGKPCLAETPALQQ